MFVFYEFLIAVLFCIPGEWPDWHPSRELEVEDHLIHLDQMKRSSQKVSWSMCQRGNRARSIEVSIPGLSSSFPGMFLLISHQESCIEFPSQKIIRSTTHPALAAMPNNCQCDIAVNTGASTENYNFWIRLEQLPPLPRSSHRGPSLHSYTHSLNDQTLMDGFLCLFCHQSLRLVRAASGKELEESSSKSFNW